MRKLLMSLLLVLITSISLGQNKNQDVIYLKHGNIIRGTIIEQVPNKFVKIETADKIAFVLQMDEIESITINSFQKNKKNINNPKLKSNFKGIIEVGFLKASQNNPPNFTNARIKLNAIAEYQINPYISLGLGTGFRSYFPQFWTLVPLYANFKAKIPTNEKFHPYISLGAGRTFQIKEFEAMGYLLDPRAGISVKTAGSCSLSIAINYEMHLLKERDKYEKEFGPICILLGVSF